MCAMQPNDITADNLSDYMSPPLEPQNTLYHEYKNTLYCERLMKLPFN